MGCAHEEWHHGIRLATTVTPCYTEGALLQQLDRQLVTRLALPWLPLLVLVQADKLPVLTPGVLGSVTLVLSARLLADASYSGVLGGCLRLHSSLRWRASRCRSRFGLALDVDVLRHGICRDRVDRDIRSQTTTVARGAE